MQHDLVIVLGWDWSDSDDAGRSLTCTLGPANEWGSRWAGAALPGPGQHHADLVLSVWVEVPELVGDHVDAVDLGEGQVAGAELDLAADDGAVAQDRVGVELDDQVGGASSE